MKVYRTRDRRYRVEVTAGGEARVYRWGGLVKAGALPDVAAWLAAEGVRPGDLVED